MKKFAEEVVKYFWIPLIMGLVSYIFFQLKDVVLGIIVLVGLSAVYTLVRLYFTYKKWWLGIILIVVVFSTGGAYFLKAPTISLYINGEKVTSAEVSINGGTILVSPEPKNGLYPKGTVVTLTATAGSGQDWKSWVGTQNDSTNPTTIKMDSTKQIRVNFESRFSLIINNQMVIGSFLSFMEGDITVNPPPDNDGKYTNGTVVSLSVRPNTGYDWTNWSGTASDNTNPTTVVMSGGNKNVSVNFEGRFPLIINNHLVIGPTVTLEQGSVTVDPAPGEDDKYAYGTKITLTANPDLGYGWKTWSGTSNDGTNPATITINSEKHVDVSFEERYLVMINNQVLNSAAMNLTGGTISSEPAPGADFRFKKNSIATLTAVPAPGYRFDKWSGDVSDTVTAINVIMNANKSISAAFIKVYNLTTNVNVSNGGTVSPASGIYDTGTEIILTATPAAGYRFDKWTGSISGNTTSTKVVFDNDMTITANFIKTWHLAVSADPPEGGSVYPLSGTYDDGVTLQLVATPADGFLFDSWVGDVSGNETTANVTMTKNMSVTAKFIPVP